MQSITQRLSVWALAVVFLLFIPLILTLFGSGVDGVGFHWTAFDFIFAFVLLFGSGAAYELVSRRSSAAAYKVAVGLAVITSLALVWINGAVGIIGNEDNPLNLMYFGVLVIGMFGASIARLRPQGLSYTLFAMALAQMLVPIIAFIIAKPQVTLEAPGLVGVFALNAFFALLFTESALLFRQAGRSSLESHTA